ncbi:C2H2 finger domain-containing protein [Colletotrichum navitas]|uniref:C2H2 finger domain-containing protein n=1 Tax=Colletotrichum navitas TaxID=681940 RepID=A0AAD8QCW7_9PEZI|nr:C2H2 finger domain-containing protein [Colletotrichum navitas]KAK1600025.1 C2H2 finger domain-containing protein [Colletotrichum navitas]
MASTYAVPPASFHDGQANNPSNSSPPNSNQQQRLNATSFDRNHLSPSSQFQSSSLSPSFGGQTPAESVSNFSQYQSSDYSDIDDGSDPFFGVSFNATEAGTPSFLDPSTRTDSFGQTAISQAFSSSQTRSKALEAKTYPLTPDQASLHTTSPGCDGSATARSVPGQMPTSISPQELQKPFQPHPISTFAIQPVPQLTPNTSGSGRSSEDSAVPSPAIMAAQSPRVTVSMWGRDTPEPVQSIERTFTPDDENSPTAHGDINPAGDLVSSQEPAATGSPQRRSSVTRHGLDPDNRPSTEIASVNEMNTRRKIEKKNQEVDQWLSHSLNDTPVEAPLPQATNLHTSLDLAAGDDGVPFGDRTENRHQPGQTYFTARGGEMTATDLHIMHSNRVWGDSPLVHPISRPGAETYQPETSQAAIARFRQMCDNQSIVSNAPTWGTRRRSLPSVMDMDMENVTSGSLLKKLSISRGESGRRPSILKDLRGLVSRSSSQRLKRSNSTHGDDNIKSEPSPPEKRESLPHLLPSARTGSWSKTKTQTPSINTALVSMGSRVASIGTTHARNGSIGGAIVTSPKSPLSPFAGLQVKNTLRRPRSKSDLPRASAAETHSNLVGMWRKSGGPPVAVLAKGSSTNVDVDDDDEDEDEPCEDGDMNADSSKLIEGVSPNFVGFQQHVLRLNPDLATTNNYLVDRIAHQQVVRYKSLLNAKVKHLGLGPGCSCGALCLARGGRPVLLDQRGDSRDLDPLSTGHDFGEGDSTPVEGAITTDSFPRNIPMPPTQSLPAEFECQLCFTLKKPKKPSDWTKHVHEDVQPFTCTWDRCREPKIFKRKADWVRHENEGHRHLEWWTCDVDDCRHTCYRRDNFLQHLVREHKFVEPKNKTKAAIKKAGAVDPTWQKVEQCRHETSKKPQEEPCRFCGRQFPTWKKLTVHLAKHMEHISLPILRLVAAKELEPDTVISPVQDPPPRAPFSAREPLDEAFIKSEQSRVPNFAQPSAYQPQGMVPSGNGPYHGANQFGYAGATGNQQFQDYIFSSQFSNGQPMSQNLMGISPINQGVQGFNQQYHNANGLAMPASSYMGTQQQYMPAAQDTEPFPSLNHDALGLHQPDVTSVPMGYDGLVGPGNLNENHYASQESISPYSHSPLPDGLGFYPTR